MLLPPIGTFLAASADGDPDVHERNERYWRLLEALDADVHAGLVPSSALSLAVVFLHVIERQADPTTRTLPGPPGDVFAVAGEVMGQLASATRISRRDYARARRIIANQRRFTQPKSKRFRPLLFMLSEDFEESLRLFRLRSAAWGQGWDVYEGWAERYRRAKEMPDEEVGRLKRSRRRRRRRRNADDGDPED